jgi:tetratricopeptide (TPR) repeat protein
MNNHLRRVELLINQSRYDMAEQELRQLLAMDPESALAHAYLAMCLSAQEEYPRALEEAKLAIRFAPDMPFSYYVLAIVQSDREDGEAAEEAIRESIRLDPEDPDNFAMLSYALTCQSRWRDALAAAEKGLSLDPEHVNCINYQAISQTMLGQKGEAGDTLRKALAQEPENAFTHANLGRQQLHENDYRGAMESFREALRQDPTLDWAREGIVEAIKAHNPIYRFMLRYFLWMSRLKQRSKWIVVISGVVAYHILRRISRSNPDLAPYLQLLIVAYIVFVVLSWLAGPLSDLLLRAHPDGKMALTEEQKKASNIVGALIVVALTSVGVYLGTSDDWFLKLTMIAGFMLFPVSGYFRIDERNRGPGLKTYIFSLGVLGLLTLWLELMDEPAAGPLLFLVIIGSALSTWIINYIMIHR